MDGLSPGTGSGERVVLTHYTGTCRVAISVGNTRGHLFVPDTNYSTWPGVPLPLPRPPKKKIHNLPKNVSPSRLPHHQYDDPGADSLNSSYLRINWLEVSIQHLQTISKGSTVLDTLTRHVHCSSIDNLTTSSTQWSVWRVCCTSFCHGLHVVVGLVSYTHVVYVTCYFCCMFSLGSSSGNTGSVRICRSECERNTPNI
jgi:hypothetical protein